MIQFDCDYCEGAHPLIMELLMATNMEQTALYGTDIYCDKAKEAIKRAIYSGGYKGAAEPAVHFLVGGTQTNTLAISTLLKPYQGVLAPATGHIALHETGAIEAWGHKVLTLPEANGKITAAQVEEAYIAHYTDVSAEHMVQPGMVYISQPTETGALYSLAELEAISAVCRKRELFFYVDGARLGYGLASPDADFTLADLARLTDIFYIGGTKVGALFGEALVIMNPAIQRDFRYNIKQHGAMLAKGRLLGLQFLRLFTDNLYLEISKGAVEKAMQIKAVLEECGVEFFFKGSTNQLFPIFSTEILNRIEERFKLDYWRPGEKEGTHCVRICTSWATRQENVDALISYLREVLK